MVCEYIYAYCRNGISVVTFGTKIDPHRRITADESLRHPWLAGLPASAGTAVGSAGPRIDRERSSKEQDDDRRAARTLPKESSSSRDRNRVGESIMRGGEMDAKRTASSYEYAAVGEGTARDDATGGDFATSSNSSWHQQESKSSESKVSYGREYKGGSSDGRD